MKLLGLLFAFLFAVCSLCSASDSPVAPNVREQNKQAASNWRLPLHRLQREQSGDTVCYTMRSYVVARESHDSDVVRPVRYVKCQPAWKFEVRSAVANPQK